MAVRLREELLLPSSAPAHDALELQSSPRLLCSHCPSAQQCATQRTACAAPHIPAVVLQKALRNLSTGRNLSANSVLGICSSRLGRTQAQRA